MTGDSHSRRVSLSIWFLALLAILFALWPVYRTFLNIEISVSEGWNAYYTDAAMGRGTTPLYPTGDLLITNNYPPLSFYIVGALGQWVGDPVLAGRLLSMVALVVTSVGIALAIKQLGGSTTAGVVGALYFVATMCRFFTSYVGMNDPHLLAQAVMLLGFVAFLRAMARDKGYAGAFLLMVLAGFIKHNIFAMPLTALVWLGIHRPRQMVKSGLLSLGIIAMGFALCYHAYGADFFTNMSTSRAYSWWHALSALGYLQWVAVGLAAWVYVGIVRRRDPKVQLCSLLIGLSLLAFLVQKTGDGVSYNAEFELVLGVSIGVGLVFAEAPFLPLARRHSVETLRFVFLLAICIRLLASARNESVRLLADRSFRAEIARREAAMAATITRIKMTPGNVFCVPLACYRAGKPFTVDFFNCEQRIKAGKLPPDAINDLVRQGKLTILYVDPLDCWWIAPGDFGVAQGGK
jgi:4-amino-4-deoxy-L-arabinose transferase-like glycosyltransferase